MPVECRDNRIWMANTIRCLPPTALAALLASCGHGLGLAPLRTWCLPPAALIGLAPLRTWSRIRSAAKH